MRLFIAEKPSLARAIAAVLPGPPQRRDGYLQCGSDDIVAWCAGHILELAAPDAYDPAFKQWRLEHLPIAPKKWELAVSLPDLLKTIRSLLPQASRVVHAGDPDREGQLLVDEVLVFLGYRGPVDRLLVSDLNPPAVRRALDELKPNTSFRGLYEAALARQRADWLYGINLTRLYTLLGRSRGYDGVLSVGRVQTPLLGIIVRRDLEIEQFRSQPYYVVRAALQCAVGSFIAKWQPPTGCELVDEHGRLLSRDHALALEARISGAAGVVSTYERQRRADSPPLPYSLPALQVDAGRRLGLSPKQTLEACQALYETHRLVTYPRSDCSFLPEGQLEQSASVVAAVAKNLPSLAPIIASADDSLRSRAWNDKKVTAHHAIIPTVVAGAGDLPARERSLYELVARRYLAQFYAQSEHDDTRIDLELAGERFRAHGRVEVSPGWRRIYSSDTEERSEDGDDPDDVVAQALPSVRGNEPVTCVGVKISDEWTTPPKRFTDATLIEAMTGVARFVADPAIKRLLRETDGIGTPATQAQIIQTLFDREFIEKKGRQIQSTAIGRSLIAALPPLATRPDMTALWEAGMRRIGEGQLPLVSFLDVVLKQIGELVRAGATTGLGSLPFASSTSSRRRHSRTARRTVSPSR